MWDGNGIAPTMKTGASASQQCVVGVIPLNEYEDGTCRTIKNQYGKSSVQNFESTGSFGATGVVDAQSIRMVRTEEGKANRKAYESGELEMAFNEGKTEDVRTDGIANCVDTVQKDLRIVETKVPSIKIRQAVKNGFIECEVGGVCDLTFPSSTTRRGRVQESGQVSPTLTTENIPSVIELGNPDFYNFLYEINGEVYLIRIRKLIPRECLRLMDVPDDVIDRMEKVESNTNLYKAAGNSIVTNCLVGIFGMLFEGKENIYKEI